MQNNKIILNYCPNFDKIINTDFVEGDNFSFQLVQIYKDFIFKININDPEEINQAIYIDKTMGKYVDDYFFRKTLKEEMLAVKVKTTATDIIKTIVNSIISIFKKYELDQTRKIYVSKWI